MLVLSIELVCISDPQLCGGVGVGARSAHRFFRGAALYMIVVDHIVGDPLSRFSYQHLGFSDAAEIFVFLSGLGCGIAYARALARYGWGMLLLAVTKRATRIYLYYGATSGIVILGAMSAASWWHIDVHGDGLAIQGDQLAAAMRLMLLLKSPPAHTRGSIAIPGADADRDTGLSA